MFAHSGSENESSMLVQGVIKYAVYPSIFKERVHCINAL